MQLSLYLMYSHWVMNTPATMTTPDLSDEVVVVTGGSRGIGAGTARRFAALGARVVVSGRDREAMETVVSSITSSGGRAVGIPAECTDQGEVDALLAGTEAAFGPATVLLAFAGGDGRPEPIDQLDAARWRSVIDSNLTATYITVRTFALGMTERRRGSIVTMSSTAGRQPGGASVAYAAAKAGIVMLTRHLANDLAPHGVRINCIAPSAIETERLVSLMPAAAREQLGQSFPLRRLGTVDDVADAALYLATAQSAWVTGITIDVSGGRVTA
jgi:3-oxoacyl-[acyl-carrier protein] reductase